MKDFLKIFLVLILIVAGFMYGRKYGEEMYRESEDYKNMIRAREEANNIKSEFENLKAKFQNVVDSAETKTQEELLTQIMNIFLVDLALQVHNQQAFTKAKQATPAVETPQPAKLPEKVKEPPPEKTAEAPTPEKASEKVFDFKRLKSQEWILTNTQNKEDVWKHLKGAEIKDLNTFLQTAKPGEPKKLEEFFGSYRGRIQTIDKQEYGTLAIQIQPENKEPPSLKGYVRIFKNGNRETNSSFDGATALGYTVQGSASFVFESGQRYFQIYKIQETQQLAGYIYERMVNGTTKTIGTFALNRVDRF